MRKNPDRNAQVSEDPDRLAPISAEAAAADAVFGAPAAEAAVEPAQDLGELLRKAETEAAELKDAWLRARAETENVRKQAQNDVVKAHKYAIERFSKDLLNVRDALELALATPHDTIDALKDGVELTLKNLNAAFEKAHVVEIDPMGEKYDPHKHQAVTMIESDQPPGTVVQVFQKGYLLNDRVLRPAMVAVAKSPESAT
jgi:molecular chaperone GrpE